MTTLDCLDEALRVRPDGAPQHYGIAGVSLRVESDLPLGPDAFHPRIRPFAIGTPGPDVVTIRHHFELPGLSRLDLGKMVYRRDPWAIYQDSQRWIYTVVSNAGGSQDPHQVAVFSRDHCSVDVFNRSTEAFLGGTLQSLTALPTDEILVGRVLAERQGLLLHAAGLILGAKGVLFAGHSGEGKSTILSFFRGCGEVLCHDRAAVRQAPNGFSAHSTWFQSEPNGVQPCVAPLTAVFTLRKARENVVTQMSDSRKKLSVLLSVLVRPLATSDWWSHVLPVIECVARGVPIYEVAFDKGGAVANEIEDIVGAL